METLKQEFYAPLGRLTMAFSALESSLAWFIGELLGGDEFIRGLFESQLSFQRLLNVADGTYSHKVADTALIERWQSLQSALAVCEEKRNTVTHSSWGIWWEEPDVYVSQEKTRIKRGKGIHRYKVKASVDDINNIATDIENTNLELMNLVIETNKKGFIHTFDEHLEIVAKIESKPAHSTE
ncbi:MAG: hypothetical protein WC071_13650 [Victivallaceae bacterium]